MKLKDVKFFFKNVGADTMVSPGEGEEKVEVKNGCVVGVYYSQAKELDKNRSFELVVVEEKDKKKKEEPKK